MGILSWGKNLFSKAKWTALTIAKLKRVKLFNRVTVLFSILQDLVLSILQSANAGNPAIWMQEVALILFRADYKIVQHIETLQSGVSNWEFISLTLGIYGQLWIFLLIGKFFKYTAKKWYAGKDVSEWSMGLWMYIFPVGILLWAGGVAHMAIIQGDSFTASTLISTNVIPFYGIFKLITNIDIWITPLQGIAEPVREIAYQNTTEKTNNWTTVGLNSTN